MPNSPCLSTTNNREDHAKDQKKKKKHGNSNDRSERQNRNAADDLAMVSTVKHLKHAEAYVIITMRTVKSWLERASFILEEQPMEKRALSRSRTQRIYDHPNSRFDSLAT